MRRTLTHVLAIGLFAAGAAFAQSADLVISQVYGGGGNSGATYLNDFVEIYNRGASTVSLSGKSVQYTSATGTGLFGANSSLIVVLSGSVAPGKYFLVQLASGGTAGAALPTPDATGTINMSGTAGKVALVNSTTGLGCNGGSTACSAAQLALIIDLVGYGNANFYEGSGPAPTLSNTTAAIRGGNGATDTNVNSADFTAGTPTPRNSAPPPPPPTCTVTSTISQVQGSGSTSPVVGTTVGVRGVVTGRKSNGFFLQDATGDGNTATSDGIYVFTSSTPPAAAAVGNDVCVTGTVAEFSPSSDPNQRPITELTSPTVTLQASGVALPAAVTITAADTLVNDIENLEKYESMRVSVGSLTVIAPTDGTVSEVNATSSSSGVFYGVVAGVPRPAREAGVQLPDPLPGGSPCCVPRFDTNPERIRVDSDGLGGAKVEVASGASVTGITGVLDYGFRTYTILPDASATLVVSGGATVTPAPVPAANELTIASFNMERFFDTVDDPGIGDPVLTVTAFNNRLNKASLLIRNVLNSPDILGVMEVENLATLQAVAAKLNADSAPATPNYTAYLFEGNDPGGIDAGFLVKASRVSVLEATQIGKDATYINPNNGQPELLNDRPPLLLRAKAAKPGSGTAMPVTVIANHLRSLNGIDDSVDGNRIRTKRRAQAEFLADLIQTRQAANPQERIAALGDFNAFAVNDGYVDLMNTIKGTPTPSSQVVLASSDLVNPDLVSLEDSVAAADRYSYVFDGNTQSLDHIVVNAPLNARFARFAAARVNADFPESDRNNANIPNRLSDHDPEVGYFTLPDTAYVTAQTAITGSGLIFSRTTRQWSGTVTVKNTGAEAIAGPVSLVLANLPAGVTLINAAGTIDGKPYVTVSSGDLAPGASLTVAVRFTNSGSAAITYTPQVAAGTL